MISSSFRNYAFDRVRGCLRRCAAMWKRFISHPWVVLVFLVIGGPGTIDDAEKWVEILGVNVLTTLALVGLTAHITAVGFQNWEPYRSWLRRIGLRSWYHAHAGTVQVVCLTADTENKKIECCKVRFPVREESLIEFPVVQGKPKYCIVVPKGYRVEFVDDDRYYVPRDYGSWPERESRRYILADHPPPQIARCKIAVYWVGEN